MLRLRLLATLTGALLAGLSLATIATAVGLDEGDAPRARGYAFGVGNFGPGCWETHGGPFCTPFHYTVRLLGVRRGLGGRAWGEFERRNNVTGGRLSGRVTCMTVAGNRASIGGFFTPTSGAFPGDPFLIYVEDNGTLGTATPDQVSALAALPPGDPDLALLPAEFPRVCPSADSIYGYLPLTSGDITISGRGA